MLVKVGQTLCKLQEQNKVEGQSYLKSDIQALLKKKIENSSIIIASKLLSLLPFIVLEIANGCTAIMIGVSSNCFNISSKAPFIISGVYTKNTFIETFFP